MSTVHVRPVGRTLLLALLSVLMAVAASAASAVATKPALGAADKPTIVLVHGAWAGPSGWDEVVARLNKRGFATVTPTPDLASLAGDVANVQATLDAIAGDKILVAHSYGGVVASNAAFGRSDVLGLVFSAAFLPDAGESIVSVSAPYTQSEVVNHLVFDPFPFAYIDRPFLREIFAQDLSPKLAERLNAAQRPINVFILGTPSGPAAWRTIPSWYAVSAADRVIDPVQQRWMAERANATVIEFDDASHAGGYTHYSTRFVKLIEQAAAATAG